MKINTSRCSSSFCAILDNKTRKLIQDADKYYRHNLEERIDSSIKESPLGEFGGDDAKISFVETENPHCNIAPVISLSINGVVASHVLKGTSEVCEEQDFDLLVEKMNRRPHRYVNTIVNRLNGETVEQIKAGLALSYLSQIDSKVDSKDVIVTSFEKLI